MKKNAIFLSFDDNYAHLAKSCINSILSNYPEYPEILVNYRGSSQYIINSLNNIDRLKIINLISNYEYNCGPISNNIVFDRFLLWTEFDDYYENILHLDVDTIVLKNLDYLFEKNDFYAVYDNHPLTRIFKIHDKSLPHVVTNDDYEKVSNHIKLDNLEITEKNDTMINAGVFFLPKKYRNQTEYLNIISLANKYHKDVSYADQSIISLWAIKNGVLPSKNIYDNFQMVFLFNRDIEVDFSKISILHFTGNSKFRDKYMSYATLYERSIYEQANKIREFYRVVRQDNTNAFWMLKSIETMIANKK